MMKLVREQMQKKGWVPYTPELECVEGILRTMSIEANEFLPRHTALACEHGFHC